METAQEHKDDLDLKDLGHFTGTEQYHNVMGTNITDGVAYIMNNGYCWFITDSLVIINSKLKNEEFITAKLKVNTEKKTAQMILTDGNDKILYTQDYEYTNAKRDLTLFFTDNVYLLDSEY